MGLAIPGLCLTLLVLLAFAYTYWHPLSKHHLDRVSFRLLVYALIANLVFGITWVLGPVAAVRPACGFVGFLDNLSLMFSAGMFFCMALNLQLVLVHGFNGQQMEKFYILGTALVCLVCNVIPYAAGEIGWNDQVAACWIANPDETAVLRWVIGTESFWVFFMVSGEVLAFLSIVGYIVSYEIKTRRILPRDASSKTTAFSVDTQWGAHRSPIMLYRNVVLRIGLYPLLSCIINFSTSTLDLYSLKNPELTELNWRLDIVGSEALQLTAGSGRVFKANRW
ncbi:hypothetical protein B0H10DRAFT_2184257 [Mycena sp. CBHHK59/15]|nr:hypothetical protein B0H10DRAFT_2184257 [Mycena sp. CBHHK59/15]